MNLTQIETVLEKEPAYRLRQVKKAVFQDLIDDWNKATTLPLNLREILNRESPLSIKGELFFLKIERHLEF